jgi:short-subunit dehydrogenase
VSERSERQVALVTGASSGIGEAFAEELAARGFDLVVAARRELQLAQLASRLSTQHGVRVEVMRCDFSERGAVADLCDRLARRCLVVHVLVNCAGFGVAGRFADSEWGVYDDMLQVMVAAPTELISRLLPGMVARRSGLILNVASLAGLADVGAGAVYGAAKTFLVSLSTSLAREVAGDGVRVTTVCPGLTRTDFHAQPSMRATVAGTPAWMWMEPATVAREGLAAAAAGRTLVVNGGQNRLLLGVVRYVPRAALARAGRLAARMYRRLSRAGHGRGGGLESDPPPAAPRPP